MLPRFGASACRKGMRNTLLPCSVGRADVRITDAWIYPEAEKAGANLLIELPNLQVNDAT